jgi:hypothetical protein
MPQARSFQAIVEGKTFTIETGKLAALAGGAVTVRLGDSLVFASATMSKTPREGADFFRSARTSGSACMPGAHPARSSAAKGGLEAIHGAH